MNEGLFEYPWVLAGLLLLLPLGWLMFTRARQRSGPMVFSQTSRVDALTTSPRVLAARLLPVLRLVALALVIVALARPTLKEIEEAEVEGIDIYVALDLSGSMQSVDISPEELARLQSWRKEPPNRFNIARDVLQEFVRSRRVDRIGMVVFARDAFLQFPLTLDYNTILTQLTRLELGDIDGNGTAIGNALGRCVAGLKSSDARSRLVILITDGDRRGGNISPRQAAEFAKELGIQVFPILVGVEGQSLVPVGRDRITGRLRYEPREYPVNPELLQEIADMTGGTFYRATDGEALAKQLHAILDAYEKSRIQDISNVTRTEVFGPLLAVAIFLLMLELALRYALVKPFP